MMLFAAARKSLSSMCEGLSKANPKREPMTSTTPKDHKGREMSELLCWPHDRESIEQILLESQDRCKADYERKEVPV